MHWFLEFLSTVGLKDKNINIGEKSMDFIDVVVELLNKPHSDSRAVYDILSALRGPDEEGSAELKKATTARLRSVIGLADAPRGLVLNPNPVPKETVDKVMSGASAHFVANFTRAAKAVKELYGVDLLNEKMVKKIIPELIFGKLYTLYTKNHPLGRGSMVVAASVGCDGDPSLINIISTHDGRPWFKQGFGNIDDLHDALVKAKWLINME